MQVAAYLVAALLPWVLLDRQEVVRYSPDPSRLWPTWTIATLLHAAVLGLVLWQQLGRTRTDTAGHGPSRTHAGEGQSRCRTGRAALGVGAFVLLVAALAPTVASLMEVLWLEPIAAVRADMIPLVQSALRDFWTLHQSPYHAHEVGHWWVAMTFMPGLWLPYSIPFLAGVDIRTWSLFGVVGACLLLVAGGTANAVHARDRATRIACAATLLAPAFLLFGETFRFMMDYLHLGGYWLALVLWGLALRKGSHRLAGVLFALCVLSRPYMVIAVPFYAAWSWNTWRRDRMAVLHTWVAMLATGSLVGLPFLLHDPRQFIAGVLVGYDQMLGYHIEVERWRTHGFGLTGLLFECGWFDWKLRFALLSVGVLLVLTARRLHDACALLLVVAAALFLFLGFAIIPWFYVFVSPLLLMALAAPTFGDDRDQLDTCRSPIRRRLVGATAAGLGLLLALFVGFPFLSPPDSVADARHLRQGFDAHGWVVNDGQTRHLITAPDAYFALPVEDITHRWLVLDFDCTASPPPDAFVDVYVNTEFIGSHPLTGPGALRVRLAVPRQNLFRGANAVRLRLRQGTITGDADLPGRLGLSLTRAAWEPFSLL
ncbi:MAG: hypothetical protein KF858_00755 [Candidatus Sumerlaeia bacterium]|nr:hypothetical protein [Candidatus Sumerlaeia bacterium]